MLKEVRNVVYLLTIFFTIFFVTKFYLSENNIERGNRVMLQHQKVQVIKFDTIFEKEFKNNIDSKNSGVFVKVDVEGSELEFLIGAFKTLKMLDNVVIQLEFTIKAFTYSKEDYIINYKKRLDLLKSAGFKRVFYSDRNKEFQLADINDFDLKHVFEDKIKLHKTNEYKNVYIYDVLFSKWEKHLITI